MSQGLGVTVRKAGVLSYFDEDYLWSLGLLGIYDPQVLLNTVVFMIGKGFALRVGKEHHALRSPPFDSQLQFMCDKDGFFMIRYREEIGFKTNKDGLKHRKVEPKEVDLYPIANVDCCPVQIIIRYLSLFPKIENVSLCTFNQRRSSLKIAGILTIRQASIGLKT